MLRTGVEREMGGLIPGVLCEGEGKREGERTAPPPPGIVRGGQVRTEAEASESPYFTVAQQIKRRGLEVRRWSPNHDMNSKSLWLWLPFKRCFLSKKRFFCLFVYF